MPSRHVVLARVAAGHHLLTNNRIPPWFRVTGPVGFEHVGREDYSGVPCYECLMGGGNHLDLIVHTGWPLLWYRSERGESPVGALVVAPRDRLDKVLHNVMRWDWHWGAATIAAWDRVTPGIWMPCSYYEVGTANLWDWCLRVPDGIELTDKFDLQLWT